MKKTILIFLLIVSVQYVKAQHISIAPATGLNFGAFGYPHATKVANSILSYPYSSNLNVGLGVDIGYSKGKKRHLLSISSTALGVSFKGQVEQLETKQPLIFKHSSSDNQLLVGYQLFFSQNISKEKSKRKLSLFYGVGIGVGFNKSKQFYQINNTPISGGLIVFPDSIFYAYEYTKNRIGTGYFIMPEVGFTYYNKKNKPVVNASFYYYLGLRAQTSYNLTLQYGKLNTSYFVEEKPTLATKGGLFGLKLSFPFRLFTLKSALHKKS